MTDTNKGGTAANKPVRRQTPAKRANGRHAEVRMEYVTVDVPDGEPLRIPRDADGEPPEVQVLSVDRHEGHGMGNWINRWHVVVIWR